MAVRTAKATAEAEWKVMLAEHEQSIEEWKVECERLREAGTWVKDPPKNLKQPRKPQVHADDLDEGPSGSREPDEPIDSDSDNE